MPGIVAEDCRTTMDNARSTISVDYCREIAMSHVIKEEGSLRPLWPGFQMCAFIVHCSPLFRAWVICVAGHPLELPLEVKNLELQRARKWSRGSDEFTGAFLPLPWFQCPSVYQVPSVTVVT